MDWLPILLGALAFGLLGFYVFSRRAAASRRSVIAPIQDDVFLVIHDGTNTDVYRAEHSKTGTFLVDGVEYPPAICRPIQNYAGFPGRVYLVAIEPIALHTHRELERVRFGILVGNIFKPAGDMIETLRIVGYGIVIAAAAFVWLQVSTVNSQLAKQNAAIEQVQKRLEEPFIFKGP